MSLRGISDGYMLITSEEADKAHTQSKCNKDARNLKDDRAGASVPQHKKGPHIFSIQIPIVPEEIKAPASQT